jgi:hypothetical protein
MTLAQLGRSEDRQSKSQDATLIDAQGRAALVRRIATLLRERKANQKAMLAAEARFNPPAAPAELTVIYYGALGAIEIDVDPDLIREQLPNVSPRSRRRRRLRQLLRMHEEHFARVWADREASGVAMAQDELQRIADGLRNVAKVALASRRRDAAGVALQAAALLAAELGRRSDGFARHALWIVQALLDVAANEGRD